MLTVTIVLAIRDYPLGFGDPPDGVYHRAALVECLCLGRVNPPHGGQPAKMAGGARRLPKWQALQILCQTDCQYGNDEIFPNEFFLFFFLANDDM